jgi:hypothetical protein
MKRLFLVFLVMGCSSSTRNHEQIDGDHGAGSGFNDCSWRDPGFGTSTCFQDDQHPGSTWCTCATEAAVCTYRNFENGCSCTCTRIGNGMWWSCMPDEPFSNPCPIAPPDAGVVD